ncbi:glycoside hydrolase family 172 protein [Formosa sp. 3Alg 14/1]|uniref:glycoside hydrolase family 172 protein n=1 Tax=Formosa sp. 3Alg 14/1 TaxID=3382190 RepID=UPI0039BEB4D1
MKRFLFLACAIVLYSCTEAKKTEQPNNNFEQLSLYDLNTDIVPRAISFENPTGEPGKSGMSASNLGVGRKGSPNRILKPNEEVVLCDIKDSGTIRHIWMAGDFIHMNWIKEKPQERNKKLRSTIIRAYWDGQEYPSIECPIGDFMGLAQSKLTPYESAVHSIGEKGAMNFWLPMPFLKGAKITLTNESDTNLNVYYQIDYTANDNHSEDVGRLHTLFRRENATTLKEDFEILPKRIGKGRFVGAVLGIRTLHPDWWGEGEIKFYMDGDTEFPTLCGTGAEDWVGLSYGVQNTTYKYHGANLVVKADTLVEAMSLNRNKKNNNIVQMQPSYISMYRWHIPDPIYWKKEMRIAIQQIGCCYYERQDDWSTATFWYEPVPSAPLPELPNLAARTADLDIILNESYEAD